MSKRVIEVCDFCGCEIEETGSIEFPGRIFEYGDHTFKWFSHKLHICKWCLHQLKEKRKGEEK